MTTALFLVVTVLAAYFIGAMPCGFLVARCRGVDIRKVGSGNIGATNVGRVLGARLGLLVFVLDFAKGAVPVLLAKLITPDSLDLPPDSLPVAAGIAAFLGHLFPIYLGFRGGKGVASGAGIVAVLTPMPALFAVLCWLTALAVTRIVSVASILAAATLCAAQVILTPEPWTRDHVVVTLFCYLAGALVLLRHHANCRRLLTGTENRLTETPAMLILSKTLHVLALGLWFGMLIFFMIVGLALFGGFGKEAVKTDDAPFAWVPHARPFDASRPLSADETIPAWLRAEPGTRVAGFAVALLFPWYFGIQYVCGAIAAATALAWTWSHKQRVHKVRAFLLLVAFLGLIAGGLLEKKVAAMTVPRNDAADIALAEKTPDAIKKAEAVRAEFGRLHGYSMMMNLVMVLLVTAGMALAAQLPGYAPSAAKPSPNGHAAGSVKSEEAYKRSGEG